MSAQISARPKSSPLFYEKPSTYVSVKVSAYTTQTLLHMFEIFKVWVAKVRVRTHTCDVQSHVCICVRNPFWKVCEMCLRAACFWACDVRSHFCTLFGTKIPENATFCLKKMFLEHLFLLWNVLFCFGSSYSVFEQPKQ